MAGTTNNDQDTTNPNSQYLLGARLSLNRPLVAQQHASPASFGIRRLLMPYTASIPLRGDIVPQPTYMVPRVRSRIYLQDKNAAQDLSARCCRPATPVACPPQRLAHLVYRHRSLHR